jgi:NAD+ synthase
MRPPEDAVATIHRFLKDHLESSGCAGVVVGVSGGLDSAVVLKLSADALGPERVRALLMPGGLEKDSEEGGHMEDARSLCGELGVEFDVFPIGDTSSSIIYLLGASGHEASSNLKARLRMCFLYAIANEENRLVLGTSNKSELLVGYFTKWGDGGSDYLPIGDLYKSQVRALAGEIGVPDRIIEKAPTAGLVEGQCDEDDLCIDYDTLDRILRGIEMRLADDVIARREDVPLDEVRRVRGMVHATVHKRRMPLMLKLGARSPALDWRE